VALLVAAYVANTMAYNNLNNALYHSVLVGNNNVRWFPNGGALGAATVLWYAVALYIILTIFPAFAHGYASLIHTLTDARAAMTRVLAL
jgi:hypothetical protein